MSVNNGQGNVWKELIMSCMIILNQYVPGGTE
jgi:hypothetical protein